MMTINSNDSYLEVVTQRITDMLGGQTMIITGTNGVMSICWKKHVSDLVEVQVIRKFKGIELDECGPERVAMAFASTVASVL